MTRVFIDAERLPISLGSQAMLASTARIIKRHVNDAEIHALSAFPEAWPRLYSEYGMKVEKCSQSLLPATLSLLKQYQKADIIVQVYADAIVNPQPMPLALLTMKTLLAAAFGKPIALFPLSAGPFDGRFIKTLMRITFNRVDSIAARDEPSLDYLRECGINKPLFYQTADAAFVLEPAPDSRIDDILTKAGIDKDSQKCLVGMNISRLIARKRDDYTSIMAQLVDYIATELNATVVLLPHEIFPERVKDRIKTNAMMSNDIDAVKETFGKVQHQDNVAPIAEEYEAAEIKGIIRRCDLFIGARMHSCIGAISSGVPTIIISYSHKALGLMRLVGFEEYICDFKTMTLEELRHKTNDVWQNKEAIKKDLKRKVEALNETVWSNGKVVKDLLDSKRWA